MQKKIPDLKNQPYLGTELLMVLDKLVRDGFVRQYIRNRNTDPKLRYTLTFEGAVHLERGGYAGQQERDNAQQLRAETAERAATVNRRTVTILTWILAIGTAVAALYYATELYWNHGWFDF